MAHTSFIDPKGELPINNTVCAVGIFRKPNGSNPQHAFILTEQVLFGGKIAFRRYDLFTPNDNSSNTYTIHISDQYTALPSQAADILTDDILKEEEITGKCWSISKTKAEKLHQIILQEQQHPGTYNLLGENASLPKTMDVSKIASPSFFDDPAPTSGHNCFTWARTTLYLLDIPEIQQDLPRNAEELIASVTSRHLKTSKESSTKSKSCQIV